MKKKWIWIILIAGLLFASCRQIENPPVEPGTTIAPTGCEFPTCTPGESAEAEPTLGPTVIPAVTEIPDTPVVPTPTQALVPTDMPEPSNAPEPTGEAETTAVPTEEPEQSEFPLPSPSPVPDAELLVNNGWQRAISIDDTYEILFPDLFRGSSLEKSDRELTVYYTDPSDERVAFRITYRMQSSMEECLAALSVPENSLFRDEPEENRVSGIWQEEETVYRAILTESRYSKALLGNAFEGEEWIPGVMEVVCSYPQELQLQYETAEYNFYVINLGRE